MLSVTSMSAQKTKILTGVVYAASVDSLEVLPYANVVLLNADSTYVRSDMTGDGGVFKLPYMASKGKSYILRVSYTGMKSWFRNLPDTLSNFNLGRIILESNTRLDEIVVSAPMKVIDSKGDTTIINAEAFKTREGANLSELVRRIPGIVYDRNTKKLKYNGIDISEININGEPFFAGKNEIALENLPAEIVGKVKIYDKQTEEEKFTGIKKGDKENIVLDIQTKKKFNGTLLASAEIGAGNYNKKNVRADANYFKQNGEQMSLIFQSGNKNITSSNKDSRDDLGHFNVTKKFGKDFLISGNMSYNYTRNGDNTQSYNEEYLITGNRYQHSAGNYSARNGYINASTYAMWNPGKKTQVNINATVNNSYSKNSNLNREATFTSPTMLPLIDAFDNAGFELLPDSIRLNDIHRNSSSKSNNLNYGLGASISQKLNDKGTSIGFNVRYSDSHGDNNNFSVSSTTYYKLKNYLGADSILYRNQYQQGPSDNRSVSADIDLTQRIGKKFHLRFSYGYDVSRQNSSRSAYDLSPFSNGDDESLFFNLPEGYKNMYIDSLSNRSMRKTNAHSVELSLNYNSEKVGSFINFTLRPQHETLNQKTGSYEADTIRNSMNYYFNAHVYYHSGKTNISLNYHGGTSQPSLSDLLTLTDNIDPLNITRGNPDLNPSYNQYVRLDARNTDVGLNGSLSFSNTYNSITRAVTYNTVTGGRESVPVNINGNWNGDATINYYKNFKSHIDLSVYTSYRCGRNVSLVNEGMKEMSDRSVTKNDAVNVRLMSSFNPSWGGFTLNTGWDFSHDVNMLRKTTTYTREYNIGLNAFSDLPGNIQIRTDVAYTFRNGTYVTTGLNNQVLWNAAVVWRFMKKRQAEISAEWNDILSDRKSYSRSVSSTGLSERYSQQIGSYFLISFKYHFKQIDSRSSR